MTPAPQLSTALAGCRIVIAVDRRAGELQSALERHGAAVERAPALTILSHVDDEALLRATRELIASPPQIVVASTGVGFRGWIEAAHEAGLADELLGALEGAQIVARGPKARGAVQQAGLEADWVAESETAQEVGAFLRAQGAEGMRVAVQHHGSGADGLDDLLRDEGAEVVSLTVYRWGPPADPAAVRRSAIRAAAGEIDAVLFTSAPGAAAWLAEAERSSALGALRRRAEDGNVLLAAVGPITARPLQESGLPALIAPRGRLGSLVRSVVLRFGGAEPLATPEGALAVRSSGAVIDGRPVPLAPSAVALLRALVAAGGAVVPRAALAASLTVDGAAGGHAVEVAVARLREALGRPELIRTVVKRGYRIALEEAP